MYILLPASSAFIIHVSFTSVCAPKCIKVWQKRCTFCPLLYPLSQYTSFTSVRALPPPLALSAYIIIYNSCFLEIKNKKIDKRGANVAPCLCSFVCKFHFRFGRRQLEMSETSLLSLFVCSKVQKVRQKWCKWCFCGLPCQLPSRGSIFYSLTQPARITCIPCRIKLVFFHVIYDANACLGYVPIYSLA